MELKFRKLRADEIDIRVGKCILTEKWQGVTLLLYKDARVDMNMLDEAVGAMNWQRRHTRENANCTVGIYDTDKKEWIWKEDTGSESFAEAEKGLASDSFKRACTNWGIGRELYSAKNILVKCEITDIKGKLKPKGNPSWYVSKIGYAENGDINVLEISERGKGIVYKKGQEIEKRPSDGANNQMRENARAKEEKPDNAYLIALKTRIQLKNGEIITLERLPRAQLEVLSNSTKPELEEARKSAKIILNNL